MARKIHLSDEERQRRRERALELVAQGKIGGARDGAGRPRRRRAGEIVAEKIENEASKIFAAVQDGLSDQQPIKVRLAAAKMALDIEQREAEIRLREESQLERMSANELAEQIAQRMSRLHAAGVVVNNLTPGGGVKQVDATITVEALDEGE
jgi:hypothetical protein